MAHHPTNDLDTLMLRPPRQIENSLTSSEGVQEELPIVTRAMSPVLGAYVLFLQVVAVLAALLLMWIIALKLAGMLWALAYVAMWFTWVFYRWVVREVYRLFALQS